MPLAGPDCVFRLNRRRSDRLNLRAPDSFQEFHKAGPARITDKLAGKLGIGIGIGIGTDTGIKFDHPRATLDSVDNYC